MIGGEVAIVLEKKPSARIDNYGSKFEQSIQPCYSSKIFLKIIFYIKNRV